MPLHPEAAERIDAWLHAADIGKDLDGPLFPPAKTGRGNGVHGFLDRPMSRRAVQKLVATYVERLALDPNVTVHSFRATALTTGRENKKDREQTDFRSFCHFLEITTLGLLQARLEPASLPPFLQHCG